MTCTDTADRGAAVARFGHLSGMTSPIPNLEEANDHLFRAAGPIAWGSKLTPEQHAWQVHILLPAVIGVLQDATR